MVVRAVIGVLLGGLLYLAVGWQPSLLALLFGIYIVVEAGFHQRREEASPALQPLACLPIDDGQVFDYVWGETLTSSALAFGFGTGFLVSAAAGHGHGGLFAVAVGVGCGALLWAVSLATSMVLVAALPQASLGLIGVAVGLVALLAHRFNQVPAQVWMGLPSGWAVRVFDAVAIEPAASWTAVAMIVALLSLGRLNLGVVRRRFRVPEVGWRDVTAELVIDLLVREAADELVNAGVPLAEEVDEGRVPASLRQRATRNVDAAVRAAVGRGGWRAPMRPPGLVERLLWGALSTEQREVAAFVAPVGRRLTVQWQGALVVALLTAAAAALKLSWFTQGLGFFAVAWLCLAPLGGRSLDPALSEGALPIDVMGLLWIALQIAALRVALWIPLLLLQAAVFGQAYGEPTAVVMALRAAILILTLQPFLVALLVGGVDNRVGDYGLGRGTALSGLVVPVVLITLIGAMMIAAEPPFAEAPLDALAAVLSLAVFVLHGRRLASLG